MLNKIGNLYSVVTLTTLNWEGEFLKASFNLLSKYSI